MSEVLKYETWCGTSSHTLHFGGFMNANFPLFCSVGILLQTACSSQMSDFPPFTSRPSIHFFEQDFFPRERENSYGHFCAEGRTDRQRWMRVVILLASRLYNERETSHVVGRAKIRTLASWFGTYVNGNTVRHVIRCSDLIWLWHEWWTAKKTR